MVRLSLAARFGLLFRGIKTHSAHRRLPYCLMVLLLSAPAFGQGTAKRCLFLGNSYTYANNLPRMISDIAASTGDTLFFDSNTPGGYTLHEHSTNAASLAKIMSGNLDYVVLQEQSQLPSFPLSQVMTEVFPYASYLDSIINAYNACSETVFYMTWGRKNGDDENCNWWPPVCTYEGMDSLLNLRYRMMADSNEAILSPAGAVWHEIRQYYPSIELYQSDGSHPSVAGTYATACCFYTTLFRKNPELITYDASLPAADAATIRNIVKSVVYDSLYKWHIGEYDPSAGFSCTINGSNQVAFSNTSLNAHEYLWDFGDGDTSAEINPVHNYAVPGIYTVSLIASHCSLKDTLRKAVNTTETGIPSPEIQSWNIFPNPATVKFTVSGLKPGSYPYMIYDFSGRKIQSGEVSGANVQVDISGLPDGIYLLKLSGNEKITEQRKLIKCSHNHP